MRSPEPERPAAREEEWDLDPAGALDSVKGGALYTVSLPERALRAMVGAASGLLRESARAAVPDAMKTSKLYELTVKKMLGFLIRDFGGLSEAGRTPVPPATTLSPPVLAGGPAAPAPEGTEYMVKKALGNAIDIAGLVTLHLSPLWLIAVFSDVVLGARAYLNALGDELRARGVIDSDEQFEGVDGLLAAIQKFSGKLADNLDTPPVTVKELKKTVETLRAESTKMDLRKVIPEAEIQKLWAQIHDEARLTGRSPFEVSSALAMMVYNQLARVGQGAVGSVKVGFDLLHDNVFEYYRDSLAEMKRKGYYQCLVDATGPYLAGLRHLFEPSRESITEKVLKGKPIRALWKRARDWCRRRRKRLPAS
jgi:hypothetical protein